MLQELRKLIADVPADFADIRYEVKRETEVSFAGADLKEVGASTTDGFVVRVLKDGGFATAKVTSREDVRRGLKMALEAAEVIVDSGGKRTELADVPAVEDTVPLELDGDPREVPMEDKIAQVRKYNSLMLDRPEIATTNIHYEEVYRNKYYVSTEGSAINEELLTSGMGGEAVAQRAGLLQNIRISAGGSDGWNRLLGREEMFEERAGLAERLLDADPVKGGRYNVILSPLLAGVFTHEAFGHFSEADLVEDNESLREKMSLGAKLGSDHVTIVADSTPRSQLGYYRYDDEGVRVRPVTLMEKGVLKGRLHSRRTAAAMDEPVTGHCVAEDHRFAPIVRMGTIYVAPGEKSFDDLLSELGDGLYLVDGKGGQTSGENFTFGAQYGFIVEGGKLGPMIRDINIMGNLFTTLKSIAGAADDLQISERGGCGKGQLNIKSALGGPHVLITDMVVGGV
ncbi:MAG: TldD/PmbA family protein [Candidatus Fermentibacteraceae bacterium]